MSFRSARSCALYPGAHAVWRTSSRPAPSAGSSVRKVVGNPVGITRNRTQKASQNHSVIWYVRFRSPGTNKTKHLSLVWLRAESSAANKSRHAGARAFLRPRNRPESILVDKNPAAVRAGRQAAYHHATLGGIPRREANETYALLGRCGSFRGVRHPECLRLRRTGGRLPGGPSARQARGGPGH